MITYSVMVSIDRDIESDWLEWMRDAHIPDVMQTGYFKSYRLRRVVDPLGGGDRATYSIEYECESMEKYEAYQRTAAPALQRDHTQRYEGRFEASRTLFEVINHE